MSDVGCSKGKGCAWSHAFTRKEKQGRCWSCGSTQHQQNACPVKNEGSPVSKAKAASPKAPTLAAAGVVTGGPSSSSQPEPMASSPVPPTQLHQGESAGAGGGGRPPEVPEKEVAELIKEANAMLKEMRQLKMLALSST